jgi:uncharacterized protein YfdQ (DUF2303 family)
VSLPKESIDRIIELGCLSAEPKTTDLNGDQFLLVPTGMKVESLAHLTAPKRIKRNVALLEAASFAAYVNRFKSEDTLVFASVSETGAHFTAMLDYHGSAPKLAPAYCDHQARYATAETPEWKTWLAANRQPMDQVKFATWLEDNMGLIKEPAGADLLEFIQSLEGSSSVRFNAACRLKSGGNRLDYEEDVTLKGNSATQNGAVELPNTIMAGLRPFVGSQPYEVRARLKFRIEGRKLSLWFETIALPSIVRDSVMLLVQQIETETGLKPLIGNP